MKTLLRYFLINLIALYATSQLIQGLTYTGGFRTLVLAGAAFTIINFLLIPLLKILLLPLNLLTLGFFAWITNVIALYALTRVVPQIQLMPYSFPGTNYNGFIIPGVELTTFWVAIISSLLIGLISHFLLWIAH